MWGEGEKQLVQTVILFLCCLLCLFLFFLCVFYLYNRLHTINLFEYERKEGERRLGYNKLRDLIQRILIPNKNLKCIGIRRQNS